jgi:hypothetical protein
LPSKLTSKELTICFRNFLIQSGQSSDSVAVIQGYCSGEVSVEGGTGKGQAGEGCRKEGTEGRSTVGEGFRGRGIVGRGAERRVQRGGASGVQWRSGAVKEH